MDRGTDFGPYDAFYGGATPINGRRYCAVCGCRMGGILRHAGVVRMVVYGCISMRLNVRRERMEERITQHNAAGTYRLAYESQRQHGARGMLRVCVGEADLGVGSVVFSLVSKTSYVPTWEAM